MFSWESPHRLPKAEPETRACKKMVYFGSGPKGAGEGLQRVEQAAEGSPSKDVLSRCPPLRRGDRVRDSSKSYTEWLRIICPGDGRGLGSCRTSCSFWRRIASWSVNFPVLLGLHRCWNGCVGPPGGVRGAPGDGWSEEVNTGREGQVR